MTVNLLDVGSGFKRTAINSNFDTIESELNDNVLTKDGGTQLEADLDMNSNKLINLADGVNNSDAVNLGQVNGIISAASSGLIASQQETQKGSEASGQVFTFTGITYTVGGNNLYVFHNGVKLTKGRDYTETSSSSITMVSGYTINANDDFDFITNIATTSSVSDTSAITHTESGTDYNLATYLQDRYVVSVKDFGAVGDGATDDGPAFTLAAAASPYVIVPYSSSGYVINSDFSGSDSVFIVHGEPSMITNNNEKSGCLIDIDTVDGSGGILTASVNTAGSNYVVGDIFDLFQGGLVNGAIRDPSGTGGVVTVSSVNASGGVTGITVTTAGIDYSPNGALPDYVPLNAVPRVKFRPIYNVDAYIGGVPMTDRIRDKSIGIVAGTIRQSNTKPSQWNYVSNASHIPLGVPLDENGTGYATANGSEITINFDEDFTKVISFVVTPDETFAEDYNMSIGASTGTDRAVLKATFTRTMGHYTYWNGAAWIEAAGTGQDGNPTFTYTSGTGTLRVDHDYIPGLNVEVCPYTNEGAVTDPYIPCIKAIGNDYFEVQFLNTSTGALYTGSEVNQMCFTYSKQSTGKFDLDGSNPDVPSLDQGNLWFYGIFER